MSLSNDSSYNGPIRRPPRVSLARVEFLERPDTIPDVDMHAMLAQAATVRAGTKAWNAIRECETWEAWVAIGRALLVGRAHVMRATACNRPIGRRYSAAFNEWLVQHRFNTMTPSVRSEAMTAAENVEAINTWRATLPERERARIIHPLSNVRGWRASMREPRPQAIRAARALRAFLRAVENLEPGDLPAELRQRAAAWLSSDLRAGVG